MVVTSHKSNACSVFASQACFHPTNVEGESTHARSAEHRHGKGVAFTCMKGVSETKITVLDDLNLYNFHCVQVVQSAVE